MNLRGLSSTLLVTSAWALPMQTMPLAHRQDAAVAAQPDIDIDIDIDNNTVHMYLPAAGAAAQGDNVAQGLPPPDAEDTKRLAADRYGAFADMGVHPVTFNCGTITHMQTLEQTLDPGNSTFFAPCTLDGLDSLSNCTFKLDDAGMTPWQLSITQGFFNCSDGNKTLSHVALTMASFTGPRNVLYYTPQRPLGALGLDENFTCNLPWRDAQPALKMDFQTVFVTCQTRDTPTPSPTAAATGDDSNAAVVAIFVSCIVGSVLYGSLHKCLAMRNARLREAQGPQAANGGQGAIELQVVQPAPGNGGRAGSAGGAVNEPEAVQQPLPENLAAQPPQEAAPAVDFVPRGAALSNDFVPKAPGGPES